MHHLVAREEGGGHEPDNLVTLCGAHHRALHRGTLTLERAAAGKFTFRHADGTDYGGPPVPLAADARAKAFQALRGLGFKEGEARWALAHETHVGADSGPEALVRRCLSLLTQRWARAS